MIVGLCGYSKVGKDTLAAQMQEYERAAFADALKEEVTLMLKGLGIEADLWGADKEEWRDLLVFWGRKRREQDHDYWIKQMFMRHAPLADKRLIITDVRYRNELEWIKRQGGVTIGLNRPGYRANNAEEDFSIQAIRISCPETTWLNNDSTPEALEKLFRAVVKQHIFKPVDK